MLKCVDLELILIRIETITLDFFLFYSYSLLKQSLSHIPGYFQGSISGYLKDKSISKKVFCN